MKKLMTAIMACGVIFPAMADDHDYRLIWSDEFDVDGTPAAHWNYENGFVRNHEDQWYQPENAEVKDGCLVITARLEDRPNPMHEPGSRDWRRQRERIKYTSSCLTTSESFNYRYGRLEVRARIPVTGGAWPAIWTLGNKFSWPANGELDLMEFYRTKEGEPIILANACWLGDNNRDAWDSVRVPFSHFLGKDPMWASKFHVWMMDWDPEMIRMYVDGELLNEIPLSQAKHGGGDSHDVNPFSNDLKGFGDYILLNLALGGDNGGKIDDSQFPLRYEIDYVRVYQKLN